MSIDQIARTLASCQRDQMRNRQHLFGALPMDFNASKSRNGNAAVGRVRGVILSPFGWQRFQSAKQDAESEETWGKHFTQEDLRDRTTLSLNTLSRIFKREQGVDRQSLEYLFRGFGLELTTADFTSPTALGEESESLRANPQQDWDNAADTSVFYGRETHHSAMGRGNRRVSAGFAGSHRRSFDAGI